MISEKQLAMTYPSLWARLCPMLETFMRRTNAGGLSKLDDPVPVETEAGRRAFISELSFAIFREVERRKHQLNLALPQSVVINLANEVEKRLAFLDKRQIELPASFSQQELDEAYTLTWRVAQFSYRFGKPLVFDPLFSGCGIISPCCGDLIAGKTLIEVKAGNRPFGSVDLRQALIYCALNYARRNHSIESLALVNPRTGVYFIRELDTLTQELSAVGSTEFFERFVYAVSSPDLST